MKKIFYLVASSFLLFSCSENQTDIAPNENLVDEVSFENSKLNMKQALAYASMFNAGLEKNDTPESVTRTIDPISKVVSDVDFYIEDGDTLLYAINYINNGGYVLIAGDNSSFPILAHSNMGNLEFSKPGAQACRRRFSG